MKYEDVIELARAQDVAPHPGPDFMALMTASVHRRERKRQPRRWLWLTGGVALATAAALLVWVQVRPDQIETASGRSALDQATMKTNASHELRRTIERKPKIRPTARRSLVVHPPSMDEPETEAVPVEPAQARLSAEELYRRAESHMRAGKLRAAGGDLRRLLRWYPDYPHRGDVVADLARVEERRGQPQRAACTYQRLATEHRSHALAADARKSIARLQAAEDVDMTRCRKK